jgi:hypothetical protein
VAYCPDNIKTDLKDIWHKDVYWIYLDQDTANKQDPVNSEYTGSIRSSKYFDYLI